MARRKNWKKKKISKGLVVFLSLILSSVVLVMISDILDFKHIPTTTDIKDFLESELPSTEKNCSVHFIDVGQGDSILIISDKKNILIDAGETGKGDEVLDYLAKQGVKKIDLLIATHPHSDHIGGMDDVINQLKIGKIVMPRLPDKLVPTTRTYTDVLQAVANKGLKITPSKVGMSFDFGKGKLVILAPDGDFTDLNNTSLIAKFTYDGKSFLLTGDVEKPAENALLISKQELSADVLKVPHHGSDTSTHKEFLGAVDPKYCVVSVGDNNKFNHPNKAVLDDIKASKAEVYRTDYDGSIVFTIENGEIKISKTK